MYFQNWTLIIIPNSNYLLFFFIIYNLAIFIIFILNPQLDNFEIKPGKCLKINISVPNLRLFVGNIPKSKGKEEILDEFGKLTGKWKQNQNYSFPNFVVNH